MSYFRFQTVFSSVTKQVVKLDASGDRNRFSENYNFLIHKVAAIQLTIYIQA